MQTAGDKYHQVETQVTNVTSLPATAVTKTSFSHPAASMENRQKRSRLHTACGDC
jgi:hypothetical protein